MIDAVVVSTARTTIGRARKGGLVGLNAFDLAETVVPDVLERAGMEHVVVAGGTESLSNQILG